MAIVKRSFKDVPRRRPDASMEIVALFAEPSAPFSAVIGLLDGPHGKQVNAKSDRAYFILEGTGSVFVGEEKTDVEPYDLVHIPAGTVHGIKGKLKVLILNTPPFSPQDESKVDVLS